MSPTGLTATVSKKIKSFVASNIGRACLVATRFHISESPAMSSNRVDLGVRLIANGMKSIWGWTRNRSLVGFALFWFKLDFLEKVFSIEFDFCFFFIPLPGSGFAFLKDRKVLLEQNSTRFSFKRIQSTFLETKTAGNRIRQTIWSNYDLVTSISWRFACATFRTDRMCIRREAARGTMKTDESSASHFHPTHTAYSFCKPSVDVNSPNSRPQNMYPFVCFSFCLLFGTERNRVLLLWWFFIIIFTDQPKRIALPCSHLCAHRTNMEMSSIVPTDHHRIVKLWTTVWRPTTNRRCKPGGRNCGQLSIEFKFPFRSVAFSWARVW